MFSGKENLLGVVGDGGKFPCDLLALVVLESSSLEASRDEHETCGQDRSDIKRTFPKT